ncbi:MetQ/NlpA family ABC transporter substrate-binding protein [Companilactobacillus mishanensis]|uniref:MetQ/NlpA family ABC transporter substrate-binding protein n=1 Tax=Companilactobacillus mishanensis TaxID=2486008 RepID=UPI00129571C0|nr:MetQ/NlpA family ABC transporter substrate-binding protein [Companilactobacillus mishanensis]MQS88854.1 MetQ/NlpA family ABC transporter substrate-binding protein [Companilactobacillus mishanensis]
MKKLRGVLFIVIAAFSIFVLAGCGSQSSEKTVKVGIMASDEPIWKPIQKKLKKQNIDLKLVTFNDYNQPNQALEQGELDINAFQHIYFLNNWNKAHNADLVPIGKTFIAPLRVYSTKISSIKDLKDGDKVTLPNDATNEGRALELLESAGLIELNKASLPTVKDITKYNTKIKVTPLDAAQTAHSLDDATAAIVNNTIAADAKLPAKEDIYTEKITKKSKRWVNVIATTKKNKDNATYKKIVKAYQTESNAKNLKKIYKDTTLPAWNMKF